MSEGIRVNVRRDYAALLRAKTTPGVRYEGEFAIFPTWDTASREISEALTSHAPHLHDYQRFAVTFAVARQRAALFLEAGLGKTSSALAWLEHVRKGRSAIICAPLAALHEFENERDKFFPSLPLRLVPTADFGDWLANPEGVALVTHHAFVQERDLSGIAALVLDECFAAGTPVQVVNDAGEVSCIPIERVRVGDRIVNASGVDVVSDVHRREVPYAVRVHVAGREITCSPNHPYFTQRGWVGASDLQPGDHIWHTAAGMRLVQDGVCPEGEIGVGRGQVLRSILLSEMADAPAGESGPGACAGSGGEARGEEVGMASLGEAWGGKGVGENPESQTHFTARSAGEDLPPIESHEVRTFRAWGERSWFDGAAETLDGCTLRELDSGICFVVGSTDSRLSHALQARLGASRAEVRNRGGWSLSLLPEGAGREEGREVGFSRVDGVEILEPGDPRLDQYRDASGALYFYDLGGTRHPSFSVDGLLVHNSSVLKSGSGVIATNLSRAARPLAHRLCLSATPAPNDPTEYAAHAVFLGYMRSDAEFRARFFVRDGRDWRVKGHAKAALPRWLSRFALWMRDPAAYGMPCRALPEGEPEVELVDISPLEHDGPVDLFGVPIGKQGMSDRSRIRSDLYAEEERTRRVVELARGAPSVVWAIRNPHADALERALREAGVRVAQIAGTTPDEERVRIVREFQAGALDCIVSKAKCIGHGVNLQRAERMIYAGYDESYETLHQTMRRGWRQGRTGPFRAFLLMAPEERATVDALFGKARQWREDSERQEQEFSQALAGDLEAYHQGLSMATHTDTAERLPDVRTEHYWLQHGDSIACMGALPDMQTIPDESVDLSVFSPPFSSLYVYSSESADMGNCGEQDSAEFNLHFGHFSDGLFRVMKPGRIVALHLAQIIAFKTRHGRKGIRDLRGDVIRIMEESGFHYYGEFIIPKNPQAVSIRTKSERLQFDQFERDSLESSPCLNDYVLEFKKPGKAAVPVKPRMTRDEWVSVASGVWYDIRETDVLPGSRSVKMDDDGRHIAPLQLGVIDRCIRLWSNAGEVVFSPFAGIGSEIDQAVRLGNVGWGIELKAEYFRQACANAEAAEIATYGSQDDFSRLLQMQEA